MPRLPALVFDVNETLLDLTTIEPHFERLFGNALVMRRWFSELIVYSEALTLGNAYVPFGKLGGAVLRMLGEIDGRDIGDDDVEALSEALVSMRPYPEVPSALRKLRQAGFSLYTLTNNPAHTASKQLEKGGIADLFDHSFSIDDRTRCYKPGREAYREVEDALGLAPAELCMIACHTWDTLGAVAHGWQAALVLRPGNRPLSVGPQPTLIGANLDDVANDLIFRFAQT